MINISDRGDCKSLNFRIRAQNKRGKPMSILLQKEDRMGELSGLFDSVQSWLIPVLEVELG